MYPVMGIPLDASVKPQLLEGISVLDRTISLYGPDSDNNRLELFGGFLERIQPKDGKPQTLIVDFHNRSPEIAYLEAREILAAALKSYRAGNRPVDIRFAGADFNHSTTYSAKHNRAALSVRE